MSTATFYFFPPFSVLCEICLCFSVAVVFLFRPSIVFSSIFFFFFSIPMRCMLMYLMMFYISLKLCSFSLVFFPLCFLNCIISLNLSSLSLIHSSASLHVQALSPASDFISVIVLLTPEFLLKIASFSVLKLDICDIVIIHSFCCYSVTNLCLTLCDPMNCSTPGFPVLYYLLEFTQVYVHWVGDTIQLSPPLLPHSLPALNLSQHQGLFQWVGSSYQVAKVLELQLQHQSFQWILKVDFL